ncbi:hypothetical protein [Sphingomonas adhaesiva]|uniref:hypothetical protein n=1 Tax=Sphingomonas adhaesiva TaxID=28212 RepID=UPI002FF9C078
MTPLAHVSSVVAIWTMMLFGIRFAVAAAQWLVPMMLALWRLARCTEPDKAHCIAAFVASIDQLHVDLRSAMVTPWSATLLFSGSVMIGVAFALGSSGDAAMLVSRHPAGWEVYDVVTDCIAAILGVTGMAFIQAATARRRTASFMVSAVLALTGLGIGVVTL